MKGSPNEKPVTEFWQYSDSHDHDVCLKKSMQFINGMALLDIKALRILRLKNKVLEKKKRDNYVMLLE